MASQHGEASKTPDFVISTVSNPLSGALDSRQGFSVISMMGYFGFLVGPPLIGGISHFIGLPGAFVIVIFFSAFIALRGNILLGKTPTATDP